MPGRDRPMPAANKGVAMNRIKLLGATAIAGFAFAAGAVAANDQALVQTAEVGQFALTRLLGK